MLILLVSTCQGGVIFKEPREDGIWDWDVGTSGSGKEWLGEVGVHNLHGATHPKVTPNKHTI